MGLSLHQYIIKKRLNSLKDAILSDTPITKLYSQYGFSDYSSFFRTFKKEYGISPNEYRELHQLPDIKQ
jgi:AraC-like DNA-binding protein